MSELVEARAPQPSFTFSACALLCSACLTLHVSRARCSTGQHFLSHEDGFPASAALEKGYNRRATLLLYLNDVPQVCLVFVLLMTVGGICKSCVYV